MVVQTVDNCIDKVTEQAENDKTMNKSVCRMSIHQSISEPVCEAVT